MWASDPTVDTENWRAYSYCDTTKGTKQTAHLRYWFPVTAVFLDDFSDTFSACLCVFMSWKCPEISKFSGPEIYFTVPRPGLVTFAFMCRLQIIVLLTEILKRIFILFHFITKRVISAIPLRTCPAHLSYILYTDSTQRRTVAAAAIVRWAVGCESSCRSDLHCVVAAVIVSLCNRIILLSCLLLMA